MKKAKQWKYFLIAIVCAGLNAAFADTLIGQWDMSGTPVTKTVNSVMATTGYPSGGFTSESRTVLEYSAGDIVYGKPRLLATAFPAQSADAEGASGLPGDVSLLNKGGLAQSSYIAEVTRPITAAFKVKFDFKLYDPATWIYAVTSTSLIAGGYNRFEVRLATLANGTGQIQFYCYRSTGTAASIVSPYTVNMSGWNHLECWLQNGIMYIQLNNDTVVSGPLGGTLIARALTEYDGLTLAARFDGAGRWARIYMDNLALYTMIDGCGSWGYLPTDFNEDCVVDIDDLAVLVGQWLVCTDPQGQDCVDVLAE